MPTNPASESTRTPRTSAEVNEEIRALWLRCGGRLSTEQRREYQRLVTEWAAAESLAHSSRITPSPQAHGAPEHASEHAA
ncbi:hypothetical protein [Streptomyces aureocirculatus]|uniref:hypothetical protein n=1 Tax=Streptomyces aureocirculatus TaxID=67275 RepID=UPI000564E82B|nr:hypothetical protein [Streptomyces aureocirculatus]